MTRRILIVDDNETIREYLALISRQAGCVVVTAAGVREALAASAQGGFQIALVDVEMPDGSGLDVVRALKAGQLADRVVVMSGKSLEHEAFSARADAFLQKPFGTDQALAALEVGSIDVGPGW